MNQSDIIRRLRKLEDMGAVISVEAKFLLTQMDSGKPRKQTLMAKKSEAIYDKIIARRKKNLIK